MRKRARNMHFYWYRTPEWVKNRIIELLKQGKNYRQIERELNANVKKGDPPIIGYSKLRQIVFDYWRFGYEPSYKGKRV